MATFADVTAIIVAHDSAAVLPACLSALKAEQVAIIVVNNASRDDSGDVASSLGAKVVEAGANEGYGRGNAIGIAAAKTRYVLVCNPDIVIQPGCVAALLEAAEGFPEAGLVAPLVVEADGRRFVQPRSLLSPDHLNRCRKALVPDGPASIPFVSGACFMIERELFLSIGGFDPDIFLFYEDDDLCRRLMDMRRAPVIVPAAMALHGRGRSTAPAPGHAYRMRWHMAWSRAHVRAKHGLPLTPWRAIAWDLLRAGLNRVAGNARGHQRHAGSAAGALAHRRGERALAREGLAERPAS